jgi:hypothetical protein
MEKPVSMNVTVQRFKQVNIAREQTYPRQQIISGMRRGAKRPIRLIQQENTAQIARNTRARASTDNCTKVTGTREN